MTEELTALAAGDAATLLGAGAANAEWTTLGTDAFGFVVPDGYQVLIEDTQTYSPHPRRKTGTVRPHTVEALTAYLQRHRQPASTVWVHPTSGNIVAVIDDHEGEPGPLIVIEDGKSVELDHDDRGNPGHGEHRADLQLEHTPEWKFWIGHDGEAFSQSGFAEHIEDGAKEIVEPSPAALLEVASTFHAKSDVQFRQATRLQDGTVQFQYDEVIAASAGKSGEITIPSEFKLAVAPFVGEPKYAVTARLRYRLSVGKLTLSYRIERPHDVVRDALDGVRERLAAEFPGVVFVGTPR